MCRHVCEDFSNFGAVHSLTCWNLAAKRRNLGGQRAPHKTIELSVGGAQAIEHCEFLPRACVFVGVSQKGQCANLSCKYLFPDTFDCHPHTRARTRPSIVYRRRLLSYAEVVDSPG